MFHKPCFTVAHVLMNPAHFDRPIDIYFDLFNCNAPDFYMLTLDIRSMIKMELRK